MHKLWLKRIFLVIISILTIIPVLYVLKIAFSGSSGFGVTSLNPLPVKFDLSNFIKVISTKDQNGTNLFYRQLYNSIVVSVGTTLIGLFLSTTAAYCFSRFRFKGRRTGLMMFLVSQMFPGVMMMIPLYIIMDHLHLLNTLLGLVLVYSTTSIPFSVWMLKGYFDTIPRDLEEAALIDGASSIRIFYTIVLPLSLPALAITALFSFMGAWNEFVLAYTFMNQATSFTLPVAIKNYVGEHTVRWGLFAASSVIVSIPVVALFFMLQRYLVSGLTAGAVKG